METLLEQQRRYHEERERLMDAMVKELLHKKPGHRDSINSEHRLKMLLQQYMDCAMQLQDLYEDKDGQRKEEVSIYLNLFIYLLIIDYSKCERSRHETIMNPADRQI